VEFTSKPPTQDYAVRVSNSGETIRGEITGGNDGTTVKISNLFYNTPARRKFLKSENTEKNLVTSVVHNVIFSHPDLTVKYSADGETLIDFRGEGLLTAIKEIYGVNINEMLPIDFSNDQLKIGGYISNIKLSKKNKSRQIVIVNGRVIDGGIISAAVNEIMSNYLMIGEYPIFVLTLDIDTAKVDVNVHPQKRQVRFENSTIVVSSVEMAITKSLDRYFLEQQKSARPLIPDTGAADDTASAPTQNGSSNGTAKRSVPFAGKSFNPNAANNTPEEVFLRAMSFITADDKAPMVASSPSILGEFALPQFGGDWDINKQNFSPPAVITQTQISGGTDYRILGQIFETYLLVITNNEPDTADHGRHKMTAQSKQINFDGSENLLIIDQHALAERINFDKFKRAFDTKEIQSQTILYPEIIKLTPKELILFEKIQPHLTAIGFDIDLFGADSIRISAIPLAMSQFGIDEFLRAVLADRELQNNSIGDILRDRIAAMACKASIRAGDILTDEQIAAFMSNYKKSNAIPLCPHGRPTMIVYSKSKIESLFGRK
jgi:DNA mismatch repair protein MutL